MVSLTAILLGYIALTSLRSTDAAPLDDGVFMQIDSVSVLNHDSPVFSGPINLDLHPLQVMDTANATDDGDIHVNEVPAAADLARLNDFFGQPMEVNVKNLVTSATVAPVPWPSSYWPTFEDGINYRWNGDDEPSPAEKYARAFGLDEAALLDAVSRSNGILSQAGRPQCTSNSDCSSLGDGSRCGKRRGETTGTCIPTWYGICHAWAPAAVLEPEPRCPVMTNGVTFRPFDIKALVTQIYDGGVIGLVFTGARYDGPVNGPKDQYGRFTDAAYRDLNPGFFHIAFSNILGKFKRGFIIDVNAGPQVWNQPVRSYQVLEQTMYTPAAAARRYFNVNNYPFNNKAKSIQYVRTRVRWIVEANEDGPLVDTGRVDSYTQQAEYTYLLELDNAGNIIGGEWVGSSKANHPDFLWFATDRPNIDATIGVGLRYKDVRALIEQSASATC
ncbi:TPA: hypothetical protein N0F65_002377 [Lagenidium giganteum]|uniref:Elicitor-like transglutaminase n=1 Tax=Lagenidium giganteum TaxID=4803 RepID=A0AAV2YME9_9STRA|nr:TPA: hypothetical protein N0F65_002377 [Lagenidium giganteum]